MAWIKMYVRQISSFCIFVFSIFPLYLKRFDWVYETWSFLRELTAVFFFPWILWMQHQDLRL